MLIIGTTIIGGKRTNENISTLVSRAGSSSKFMRKSISIAIIFMKRPNYEEIQTPVNFRNKRF